MSKRYFKKLINLKSQNKIFCSRKVAVNINIYTELKFNYSGETFFIKLLNFQKLTPLLTFF